MSDHSTSAGWPPNPFSPGTPLNAEWLVGREKELEKLAKAVREHWSRLVIRGPRGMGKTTFVRGFQSADAEKTQAKIVMIDLHDHVDPRNVSRPDAVIRSVVRAILEELPGHFSIPAHELSEAANEHDLRDILQRLTDNGEMPVVVVDEVDFAGLEAQLAVTRLGIPRPGVSRAPLWIFIIGESWGTTGGATLPSGQMTEIRIGLLQREMILDLLRRFPEHQLFAFDESAEELICSETAGHPLFLAAVLDAIYDARWASEDRSPVTREDVRRAVAVIEKDPSDRIVHALRQAGPAALSVLKTLAEHGREALSTHDLREIFRVEWPGWIHEIGPALEALEGAALLRNEVSVWSHRIPIVRGYVAGLQRADVTGSDRPPRADAWAAFTEGEDLQGNGQVAAAINAYQKAVDIDGEFWMARWHLARLLFDSTEEREDEEALARLTAARKHLIHIAADGNVGSRQRFVTEILCRTLLRLAIALPKSDANRRQLLNELREHDEHLATPGAADALAATIVAEWARKLSGDARVWPDRTRQMLRSNAQVGVSRLRREAMQWVVERLDNGDTGDIVVSALDVVRFVVPVLLDERTFDEEVDPLRDALRSWLRRNARTERVVDGPYFEPHAWDTLLRIAAAGEVLSDLQAWLEHDFSWFAGNAAGAQTEELLRSVTDRQVASAIGEARASGLAASLWKILEKAFEQAFDEGGSRLDRLIEPLGRALLVFRNTRRATGADIDDIVSLYVDSVADRSRLAASPAAVQAWEVLLAEKPAKAFLGKLHPVLPQSDDLVEDTERKKVEGWLQGAYSIRQRVEIRLQGYPADTLKDVVRAYRAVPVGSGDGDGDGVMIRTFSVHVADSNTEGLMKAMWERERRAIATVSLTPAGRALLQYREHRRLDDEHVAVLVTEWPGTKTLRDAIHSSSGGTTVRTQRGQRLFWAHFIPLLEAIDALHGSGFLHRAMSPEAIYDRSDDPLMKDTLKLAHFEWSVYLRRLDARGRHGRHRERELNRYVAPEAIRAALRIPDQRSGETFASDFYALGLMLFECMVRPLDPGTDLKVYKSDESYDAKAQLEHRQWIDSLRTEVRKARSDGRIEEFESNVLLKLLKFDVETRPTRLDEILGLVRGASILERSQFQKPLPVYTSLRCHHESGDPRRDFRNVAFFLRRELPEVDAATDVGSLAPAGLARILSADLRGASVFINTNPDAALLLVSRTGTHYRLRPLRLHQQPQKKLAYLEIAHRYQGDESFGESIGVLDAGVEVFDAGMDESRIDRYLADHPERGWRDLFEIAESASALVEKENSERRSRQTLLDVLAISNEVEYALAWKEAAFVRAKPGTTLVGSPEGEEKLATTVAAWLARDFWVEVSRPRSAAGQGLEVSLTVDALDLESGVVDLGNPDVGPDKIPEKGVLRPTGNRGVATIYRRRKEALRQIREDLALLKLVITPSDPALTNDLPERFVGRTEAFIPRLDDDKRKIVRKYRRIRPCLVVQGPPGTGKTTLATEVILQTLHENPNARILVTAQGHAPLDNLLTRLIEERDRNPEAEKKLREAELVRITSGNRADTDYPQTVRDFLPYQRAERMFQALRRECEKKRNALGLQGKVATQIADALAPYTSAPTSLLRRIEDSATLVFVTTNARDVEDAAPGSFDVVIVEESARCVPMELLGVMRLARHWLLIGDHQQLPPFGYELVMHEVERRIRSLIEDVDQRLILRQSTADGGRTDPLEREAARLRTLQQNASRYMNLFQHLHTSGDARMIDTLRTQWRMHPTLGSMVSDVFYGGTSVVNPPPGAELDALVKRTTHQFREPAFLKNCQLVWIDFEHASIDAVCEERRGAGGQLENDAERRTAVALLRALRADRPSGDIAFLTPYRSQMEQLRGLMSERQNYFDAFGTLEDKIFTVDSFQGQQAGTVVLSLVRNNRATNIRQAVGFLAEPQRATVMFSRAERLLVVLGCAAQFQNWAETSWVVDIHRQAIVKPWTEFVSVEERKKLDQRRIRFA